MQCRACHKPIIEGDYRVRETRDAYLTYHRSCTSDDPEWSRIDAQRAESAARQEEYLRDCRAFYDKWGVADFTYDLE